MPLPPPAHTPPAAAPDVGTPQDQSTRQPNTRNCQPDLLTSPLAEGTAQNPSKRDELLMPTRHTRNADARESPPNQSPHSDAALSPRTDLQCRLNAAECPQVHSPACRTSPTGGGRASLEAMILPAARTPVRPAVAVLCCDGRTNGVFGLVGSALGSRLPRGSLRLALSIPTARRPRFSSCRAVAAAGLPGGLLLFASSDRKRKRPQTPDREDAVRIHECEHTPLRGRLHAHAVSAGSQR